MKSGIFFSALLLFEFSINSRASQCPTPPSLVKPRVGVKTKLLSDGRYLYEYEIKNGKTAANSIAYFYLVAPIDVQNFRGPKAWKKDFEIATENRPAILKMISRFNDISPGSVARVSFVSRLKPGITTMLSEGPPVEFVADPIGGDDEASPDCPGFHEGVAFVGHMLTDSTIGPVDSSQVDLRSKISRGLADKNLDELSPLDTGTIQLTVFLDGKIDFEDINLKSVQFGPGKALPISIVSAPQKAKKGRVERIVLTFNVSDLKIRCDLDKALFFYAKAGERRIVSSVEVNPAACGKDLWGKIRKSLPDYK